jgi:hypothetical protein
MTAPSTSAFTYRDARVPQVYQRTDPDHYSVSDSGVVELARPDALEGREGLIVLPGSFRYSANSSASPDLYHAG